MLACAPGDEAEEIARAAVLEAFADGVEERRGAAGELELAVYCADRPAQLPRGRRDVERGARRRRLGRRLARVPHGPRGGRPAVGGAALGDAAARPPGCGDRPGPRVRDRLARDHAALPRAPARPAARSGARPGLRLRACSPWPRHGSATRPSFACDDDPTAVEAARENAARNDCEIQVWQCDALYDELPKGIDLWLANLQLAPLEELSWRPDLPPRLIVSGLLTGESFLPPGYRLAERRSLDGWEGLLLEREKAPE